MKRLMLGLGAMVLSIGLARPALAHPVVSYATPIYYYPAPYPYVPPPPYYYPPAYYPYGGYLGPPATVGGYYPTYPYFSGRDEGVRSYTFPGYRGWYSNR